MNCIFCKIAKKEVPADIIYEDGNVMIFNDTRPSAPIHCLIIPKEHIQSVAHLQNDNQGIVAHVIYAAKIQAEKLGMKGYKLVFNVGREGGQLIDHLHLHLLGGWTKKSDIDAMPHPGLDK